jgi:hypothetical protein
MELIKIEEGKALLNISTSKQLYEFEKAMKELKEQEDEIKASILEEMEIKGIKSIDCDELLISYIAPSDRETFDSKKFREEHSDLYDEYVKFTPVKSSVRIKLK